MEPEEGVGTFHVEMSPDRLSWEEELHAQVPEWRTAELDSDDPGHESAEEDEAAEEGCLARGGGERAGERAPLTGAAPARRGGPRAFSAPALSSPAALATSYAGLAGKAFLRGAAWRHRRAARSAALLKAALRRRRSRDSAAKEEATEGALPRRGEAPRPGGRTLRSSYHCSRYNTQTRRLTEAMFMSVIERARAKVDAA